MAIAPNEVIDTLSRSVSGGFGTTDSGQSWTVASQGSNSDFSVSTSTGGQIIAPADGLYRYGILNGINTESEREVLVRVKHNTSNVVNHGPMLCATSGPVKGYVARINRWEASIAYMDGSNIYQIDFVPKETLANTYYWIRFRNDVGAAQMRMKVWQDGTAEPAGWTISTPYFDGSNPNTVGKAGYFVYSNLSYQYVVNIDAFYSFNLNPDSESKSFPVTDSFQRTVRRGWGQTETGQTWRGNMSMDPAILTYRDLGSVNNAAGAAVVVSNGDGDRQAWLDVSAPDTSTTATIAFMNQMGYVQLGARGTIVPDSTGAAIDGYYGRLVAGAVADQLQIIKKSGASITTLGTATLPFSTATGAFIGLRFEVFSSTLRARAWLTSGAEPGTWDLSLTDTTFTASGKPSVYVHPTSVVGSNKEIRLYHYNVDMITAAIQTQTSTFVATAQTYSSISVSATYANDENDNVTATVQYRPQSGGSWLTASSSINRTTQTVAATASNLNPGTPYDFRVTFNDPDGVSGTNPRTLTATTNQMGTDTGTISLTPGITTTDVVATYANDSDNSASATIAHRLYPAGVWSSNVSMTKDSALKRFTHSYAGLEADTRYEFRVTYADEDGVRGTNPVYQTATTQGRSAKLLSIGATASITSAVLTVTYTYDTNDDSEASIQYRSVRDQLWTTLNQGQIEADRVNKAFRATLSGLAADHSYEAKVLLSDPDGLVAESPLELTTTFTTRGSAVEGERQGKHYIYRIYDSSDGFLGTWRDAGDPRFSFDESGGVTDLTVKLPRTLTESNYDRTIDFLNRVDVWCVDGESQGMGDNLMPGEETDDGSWTLATGWTVDESAGPDGSSALQYRTSLPEPLLLARPDEVRDRSGTLSPTVVGAARTVQGEYGPAWQLMRGTTNYILNPRFDPAGSSWSVSAGWAGQQDTAVTKDAVPSLKLTYSSGGLIASVATPVAAFAAGDVIVASGYLRTSRAGETYNVRLHSYSDDGGGVDIGYVSAGVTVAPATSGWTYFEVTSDPLPAGIDGVEPVRLYLYGDETHQAGDAVWLVQPQVELHDPFEDLKTFATPYADGSMGQGHVWTSTPHQSTSVRESGRIEIDPLGHINAFRGTILARFKKTIDTPANNYITWIGLHGNADSDWTMLNTSGKVLTVDWKRGTDATSSNNGEEPPITVNQAHVAVQRWQETSYAWRLDNSGWNDRDRLSPIGQFLDTLYLGAIGALTLNGELESLIVFEDALTDFEVQRLIDMEETWTWDGVQMLSDDEIIPLSLDSTISRVESSPIHVEHAVPLVATSVVQATGGKLRMDIAAFNDEDVLIGTSNDNAESVGTAWQTIKLEWLPPARTAYVRVRVENVGAGIMRADKFNLLQKEVLIYRGRIESHTSVMNAQGQHVLIEVLGLSSQLSDDYIEFLQFVNVQPTRDLNVQRPFSPPADPGNMLKRIIDIARQQNPRCDLYYTDESIKLTGEPMEYTYRDKQLRDCFDIIRTLCPPGWHWYIEPDGLVRLQGSEHAKLHKLRLNVEIMEFENEQTIRNLKNFIKFRGRQDEDNSEPDGHGSIRYESFDQTSIDTYGLRVQIIRDANVTDPTTAATVGDGRLDELSRVEQAGMIKVPDEKDLRLSVSSLRGYNTQSFAPGDMVQIIDPISGPNRSYWDQFIWDEGTWDTTENRLIPDIVPIKRINHYGAHVTLELSHRAPSSRGDFAKMMTWVRKQASNDA